MMTWPILSRTLMDIWEMRPLTKRLLVGNPSLYSVLFFNRYTYIVPYIYIYIFLFIDPRFAKENQKSPCCNPENWGRAGVLELHVVCAHLIHIYVCPHHLSWYCMTTCNLFKVVPGYDGGYEAEKALALIKTIQRTFVPTMSILDSISVFTFFFKIYLGRSWNQRDQVPIRLLRKRKKNQSQSQKQPKETCFREWWRWWWCPKA